MIWTFLLPLPVYPAVDSDNESSEEELNILRGITNIQSCLRSPQIKEENIKLSNTNKKLLLLQDTWLN